MTCRWRTFTRIAWLGLLPAMAGCQARQMIDHYTSFDALVTDLYEKHVLFNLARRDNGRTMIQIDFKGFGANLNENFSTSGKVQFFTSPDKSSSNANIALTNFGQAFEPNISNSTSKGLSISSAPADNQEAVRALYDEEVYQPEESRVFLQTNNPMVAMRSYCWIRTPQRELYYVPYSRHQEFADFVHKICFYKPGSQPATLTAAAPPPPPPTLPEQVPPPPSADPAAAAATNPAVAASQPMERLLPFPVPRF